MRKGKNTTRNYQTKVSICGITAAQTANARFKEWARGLEKVYGHAMSSIPKDEWIWGNRQNPADAVQDTHVALLAFPQAMKPKECSHEPISYSEGCESSYERLRWFLANKAECRKCGTKLKAKWEKA